MILVNGYKQLPSGLISRWPCNEGTGTTANDVIAGRNLTLTNGPTWGAGTIVYDGVNDYSIRSSVNFGLDGLTEFSIFFKLKTTDDTGRIIMKGISDGVNTFRAQVSATGELFFAMDNLLVGLGESPQWIITTPLDFSSLTSVAFTFKVAAGDATDGLVYINGSTVGTTFTAFGYATDFVLNELSGDFLVAARPITLTDPLAGEVGDMQLYNRMLTAGEVAGIS